MTGQFDAMLSLLDDGDPATCGPILARLEQDRDLLDLVWQLAELRGRDLPEPLIHACLRADAEALVDAYSTADDLESGIWLLPRLHRPRFDFRTPGEAAVDALAAAIRPRLAESAPADARTVARSLVGDFGFGGNRETYDDPGNSYLPIVLERRCGLPIALTALWMLVCRRLRITAEAIALPGHVVGRWVGRYGETGYLDLFAGAKDLSRADLDLRVQLANERSAEPYLAAASDRALLKRLARNLALSHLRRGDALRATIAHALATG